MDLGRVLVLGGTRGVGLSVVRALRGRSGVTHVAAAARGSSDVSDVESVADSVVRVDATNKDSVSRAFESAKPDTLISCYAQAKGLKTVVCEAEANGCDRMLLVSALGCGDSEMDVPAQVYFTMRDQMMDMSLAEVYVRESKLNWTIARPGPKSDESTSNGTVLTEEHKCYGTIHADDLAEAVVRCAESDKTVGRTLAMVDRGAVLLTAPYVRPLEFWESFPFNEFEL